MNRSLCWRSLILIAAMALTSTWAFAGRLPPPHSTSSVLTQSVGSGAVTEINCGGPNYTDSLGVLWAADECFTGGTQTSTSSTITGTSDPALYQTQRTEAASGSSFTYTIPVANGDYFLRLLFAETTYSASGARVFNVTANGTTLLENFDIFAAAGGPNTAVDRTLPITVGTSGLSLVFTGTTGLAVDWEVQSHMTGMDSTTKHKNGNNILG